MNKNSSSSNNSILTADIERNDGFDRKLMISLFQGRDTVNVAWVTDEKEISFDELPNYVVNQTYSLIRFKDRYRLSKNFICAGSMAIDVDAVLALREAIVRLEAHNLNAIVGLTRNHQKEKISKTGIVKSECDRYRIIILLSQDIENEADYLATFEALYEIFPESDRAVKDCARYFFPCTEIVFTKFNGRSFDPIRAYALTDSASRLGVNSENVNPADSKKIFTDIDPVEAQKRALKFLKTHQPAFEGNGGDTHTLKTVMRLMDLGIETPEECSEILEDSGWNDKCDPPWGRQELLQKCRNAERSRKSAIGSCAPEAVENQVLNGWAKPIINIRKNQLHDLVVEAENALVGANIGLYARGPELVEPVTEEVDASDGRKTTVTRLKEVTPSLVRLRLASVANWTKWDARSKCDVPADPPKDIAESILLRDGEWKFPRLAGVTMCPTLRRDGSLLTQPGYDPESCLLLVGIPKMPEIPSKPTKDDAIKSLRLLEDLLTEFPYVDEPSRSVHLSMLVSSVVRGALSAVPLHAVRATGAGSGKSFSTDLASCLVSGQPCPVIAAGRNEEETEKRLGAVIKSGQPIINIDNVNGELGGDALCQIVERPIVQIRLLGRSEVIRVENKAMILATGNGIVLTGDMTRRVVLCSLDPNLERPELRQFKKNPLELVLEDRGKYIAAALTVVRAYLEAGCPDELPALASFRDWSRMVRSALVWLGKADPVSTMDAARAEDPQTAQFEQIITAWKNKFGFGVPRAAGKVVDLATNFQDTDEVAQKLREALRMVASDRGSIGGIDPTRLGKWLSKHRGKVALGMKLVSERNSHTGTNEWSLIQIAQDAGVGGGGSNS